MYLQRAYNKYGKDAFSFEIIEICTFDSLLLREQFYLDTLNPEFNIGKNSSGGDNISNHPNKKEIVDRIKQTINENISLMTEQERREKWNRGYGKNNPNYGNNWTDDMKHKASEREKNNINNPFKYRLNKTNNELYGKEKAEEISKKLSKIASERIGEKNGFFNKQHTDETKNKIREKRIGKYHGSQNIRLKINEEIYNSYSEASKKLNIPIVTIRWRCLSNNPKFDNYKLI